MPPETPPAAFPSAPRVGVNWLSPESASIYEGTFSLLHCAVKGDTLYRGVYAVRLFPVKHPNRFISLRTFDELGNDTEVGVIRNLAEFPETAQRLIKTNLERYYFQQVITRVYRVECEYGMLFFDVETQRGREQFVMPWRTENAQDYGESGKLLIEALGNFYIIPDIAALPPGDYRRFAAYVYW